ncbi:MAG: trimethylamine methyltransferase family protein [Anaerolineales bacterium]|nr:trimethylamine methyltransferase family protein [Anaerolineales bacterium]
MNPGQMLAQNYSPFNRLTEEQSTLMYQGSLKILERTGVRLFSTRAVDLLTSAGAQVSEGNRVRIPPKLAEWAVSTAPKQVTLYNRNGEPVMPVDGRRSFFGTGSDCLNIIDHRTWERRKPLLQDVVEGTIVCDALENIDFVMSMFLPTDVDKELADRYQMEVMLNHTTKPIVFVTYEISGCVDNIKMAEAIAGSAQALREKPFVACYVNVTTALRHNHDALEKLLFLSEKGIPFFYIPGAMAGAAGPVTVAGSNAMRMAGSLAGLVIAQLNNQGAPVFIPGWGALALDMRTTVMSYTGPDHHGVTQSIAHHLGLPMFAKAGVSDAKLIDQQAGIEAALTLLYDAVVGSQIVHDVGYLESGMTSALTQIVICDEILTWIKRALKPVEINDETLALDLIDEVGPDGQYLNTQHTLRHFREQWHPQLFDRNNYQGWKKKGSKTLAQRAAERVEEILASHKPEKLDQHVQEMIRSYVQSPTE